MAAGGGKVKADTGGDSLGWSYQPVARGGEWGQGTVLGVDVPGVRIDKYAYAPTLKGQNMKYGARHDEIEPRA